MRYASVSARAEYRVRSGMRSVLASFLRGLVFVTPIGLTTLVVVYGFRVIDGALRRLSGIDLPAVGLVILVVLVTGLGVLLSQERLRALLSRIDDVFDRVPGVRFVHSSARDVVNALSGEGRQYDTAVAVELMPGSDVRAFGFVTRESLTHLGLPSDHVTVYLPQAYNVAGQLLAVPRSRLMPLAVAVPELMSFVVSGGMSGLHEGGQRRRPTASGAS